MGYFIRQNKEFSSHAAVLTAAIRSEENRLLHDRTRVARRGFLLASLVMISSFVVALLLLYFLFRRLTAQLQATEKSEQEAERFRLFIEAVNDYAIFTMDSEGHVTSGPRLRFANQE